MGREIRAVLLMRVLAHAELHNTRGAPDQVRGAFPGARLMAMGAADCPDTALLGADRRLDDLLLLPPGVAGSPRAFRAFMAHQPVDATVMCYGATPGINYPRQMLASLLCPGRKFFLDAAGRLFPVASVRGLRVLLRAALSIALLTLLRVALRLAARLTAGRAAAAGGPGLPAPEAVRRLLFIRLDHIGDVAMSLPALQALRGRYPDARIDALVLPACAPLLADVPGVDTVIPYAAPVFTRGGGHAGLGGTLALVRRLRRERYDVAVDTRGNDLCRLIAFAAGIPRRLGPSRSLCEMPGRPNYSFLLTHPAELPAGLEYSVDCNLATLHAQGLPPAPHRYRLPVKPERRQAVRAALHLAGVRRPYVVIHARPSQTSKEWLPERFAVVAEYLNRDCGFDVLLTGAGADREYNESIVACHAGAGGVFNVAGQVPLRDLPALLEGAAVMVSVDTGPMHVGAMVGTPVVSLFQPALAPGFHPYRQRDGVLVPPAGAASSTQADGALSAIRVEDVLAMVDRKLGAAVSGPGRRVSGVRGLAEAA